jgi:hypothetical protein
VAQLDDDGASPTNDPLPIGDRLTCSCGEVFEGCDGEELLMRVEEHIDAVHVDVRRLDAAATADRALSERPLATVGPPEESSG